MAQENGLHELYVVLVAHLLRQAFRHQATGGAKRHKFCLSLRSCPEAKSHSPLGMHDPAAMSQGRTVLGSRGDMDGNIDELG